MSVKAMEWARDISTGQGSRKSVLIALADTHHQDNNTCFASESTLVRFTNMNWKTIKKALAWLQDAGFITEEKRPGKAPNYRLHFNVTSSKIGEGKGEVNSGNLKRGASKTGGGAPSKIGEGEKGLTPSKNSGDPLQKFPEPPPNLEAEQENGIEQGINPSSELPAEQPPNPDHQRHLDCAAEMWKKIEPIRARKNPPNLTTWAKHIRLLVECDEIPIETVWRVFCWANTDHFWRDNIMSPQKLREKFDTLHAKWEASHEGNRRRTEKSGGQDPGRLTPAQRIAAKRDALKRSGPSDLGAVAEDGGDLRPSVVIPAGG